MVRRWPHLQVLKSGTGRQSIVLIPGLLGHGICFHHLASLGPSGVRVIALDLPGADPREELLQLSVETIADIFEPQIRGVLGGGAVVFGGFSLGSVIAYELALRWQRHGDLVSGLVAFDGYAPGYTSRQARTRDKLAAHARSFWHDPHHLRALLRSASSEALASVRLEWLVADTLKVRGGPASRRWARRLSTARVRAERAYRSGERFGGPALLIRIAHGERASGLVDEHDYGWTNYVRDLQTHVLSGNVRHADFFAHPSQRHETADALWRWFAASVDLESSLSK